MAPSPRTWGQGALYTIKMDGQTLHMEADTMTMAGFADMLTGIMQMGGTGGKQVVDMTGLKGNYQVAVDLSMADIITAAQAQGVGIRAVVAGPQAARRLRRHPILAVQERPLTRRWKNWVSNWNCARPRCSRW